MRKSELKFALAQWAKKYADSIDIDLWDSTDSEAKKELENILTKANCEHVYATSDVIAVPNMTISLPYDKTLNGYTMTEDSIIFNMKEK